MQSDLIVMHSSHKCFMGPNKRGVYGLLLFFTLMREIFNER